MSRLEGLWEQIKKLVHKDPGTIYDNLVGPP